MEPDVAAVADALRRAGASFAVVFGSRARGDARPESDLDVAGWWPNEAPAPWKVGLPEDVDLVVLNEAPLELAGRIALEGEILFDDDPPAQVRWTATTRKIWLDERPRFEAAHRLYLESALVVDEGRVARLLRGVDERVTRLLHERAHSETRRDDPIWMDGIKYLFVTAIEGCVDVAHHIVAAERWGAPDTNADALRLLATHDVVAADMARRIGMAVGFRNVLVHQYTTVNDDRVVAALDELDDLRSFTTQVSAWLVR